MVKRGSSSFSASSVARSGVVLSKAVEKTFSLEGEVSRLRHHVSVLSRRLHLCEKERDMLRDVASAGLRPDSPFCGDDDCLPPPPGEEVAGAAAVVRLPSPGSVAGVNVAPSVADSVAVSVASSVASSGCFRWETLGSRKRWFPSKGAVVGEVDDDDDLIMGSAEQVAGPVDAGARRSVANRRNVLFRDRVEERRVRDVERMIARDGLSSPTPRPVGVLAPGRDSEFVRWGLRRLPLAAVGPPVVSPHLCPVGTGGVNGTRVRCPCGGSFDRSKLGQHIRGLGGGGGCPRGDLFSDGRKIIAAWDVDLRCLVEGCPVGGAPFTGMAGRILRDGS
ncbi:hypothetical protein B9Z19DRAFT_1125547 [Tuber borchii]|uniref:Uncharacterized protein n=1 Tax=Tuber borchii TaxID=42251 RepID=A0A2T6ZUK7_TUBBO|nr:hypothetical protein B9Z19DRAFT_1125547 [Tuber borchii]